MLLDRIFPHLLVAAAGLSVLLTVGVSAFVLSRLVGPHRFLLHAVTWLLVAAGAVPLSVLAVFWYVRTADYVWAIRGPYPFSHLGGGPFLLWTFFWMILTTAACWGTAVWLMVLMERRKLNTRHEL